MVEKMISNRDWEKISAYLDGQLSRNDQAKLKARLEQEPELRKALHEIRNTRDVVRTLPLVRAPRNFTLKPEMVGYKSPTSRLYPVFRLASVLASILFVIIALGDVLTTGSLSPVEHAYPAMAPNNLVGGVQEKGVAQETQPLEIATNMPQLDMEVEVLETPIPEEELLIEPEELSRDAIEKSSEIQSQPEWSNQVTATEEGGALQTETVKGGYGGITPTIEMLTATSTLEVEQKVTVTTTRTETNTPNPTSTLQSIPPTDVPGKSTGTIEFRVAEITLLLVAFFAGIVAFWLRRRR